VLLVLLRVLTPEDAYSGLPPSILLMIGGMIVVGLALESTGLGLEATEMMATVTGPLGPWRRWRCSTGSPCC